MSRKPFQTSLSQTKELGELIHMNLCGPMENPSVGNSRYFILLKDDYSHYRFVYFIKKRSEVTEKFRCFLKRIDTEIGRTIKRMRTDNGLKFVNKEVQKILSQYGIKHEKSVSYTPEQNGAIERENRTVVEAARSMLHTKKMPIKLWAEAVHTAIYVSHRN